jgi:hypothetical protein
VFVLKGSNMDNEQRLELHEEIKDYLRSALVIECKNSWDGGRVTITVMLDGEPISDANFYVGD